MVFATNTEQSLFNFQTKKGKPMSMRCKECNRTFDLWNADEASEWYFGHDCEDN